MTFPLDSRIIALLGMKQDMQKVDKIILFGPQCTLWTRMVTQSDLPDLATHYTAKPNLLPCEDQRGCLQLLLGLGSLGCQTSVQHQLFSRPPRMTPA